MKKLFSLILAAILVCSFAACSKKDAKSVTLTLEASGVLTEYSMEADGDIVHTITQTTTMDCTGFVEEQFNIIDEAVAQYQALYDAIEGVTYNVEVSDTAMVETLIIDATNAETLKALSEQGLMPVEYGDFISLDKTVETMTADGWVAAE